MISAATRSDSPRTSEPQFCPESAFRYFQGAVVLPPRLGNASLRLRLGSDFNAISTDLPSRGNSGAIGSRSTGRLWPIFDTGRPIWLGSIKSQYRKSLGLAVCIECAKYRLLGNRTTAAVWLLRRSLRSSGYFLRKYWRTVWRCLPGRRPLHGRTVQLWISLRLPTVKLRHRPIRLYKEQSGY
jgi:hypothetical protein